MLVVDGKYSSNFHGDFVILEYKNSKEIKIKFCDTGCVLTTRSTRIYSGEIKDPLALSVHGVGYIGQGRHKTRYKTVKNKAYGIWSGILRRCYDTTNKNYKSYGGKGCTVCREWHNFQNFANWYEENYIEGYEVDKDKVGSGKLYSPEFCVFLSKEENIKLGNGTTRGVNK